MPSVATRGVAAVNLEEEHTDFEVAEPLLVRDVIYACQGVNGKYIRYNANGNAGLGGYEVDRSVGVSHTKRQLLLTLCEQGWLFRKVRDAAKLGEAGGGAVRQAFCAALQAELADFYRLIAVLEVQANQPLPKSAAPLSPDAPPYLTLQRLSVWLAEPIARFRLLAAAADVCSGLRGGALLSALEALGQHGDPFVRGLFGRSLRVVGRPLFEMVAAWVFEGRLDGAEGEFFIQPASNSGDAGGLWRSGYKLEESMLPPTISHALAQKILRAGKSINYLRVCCGDTEWADDRERASLAAAAAKLSYGEVEALEALVAEAGARIDQRVLGLLVTKYGLHKHCDAIKRYLLLGQGDFIQSLMDAVGSSLGRKASEMSEYVLNGHLDAAVRASNAQYDDTDVLDRLRVKLERGTVSETGWDVFTLRYEVQEPLATLFSAPAMASYLRVFRLLWGLKRVEHGLSGAWQMLNAMQRQLSALGVLFRRHAVLCDGLEEVELELRHCHGIRSEMAHFTTNLQYYIMLEVLEPAWDEFMQRLPAASDLDGLLALHAEFLATLLRKALLDEAAAARGDVQKVLQTLFRVMLDLVGPVRRLHEAVELAAAETRARVQQLEARREAGQWGTTAEDRPLRGIPQAVLADIRNVLQHIGAEFSRHQALLVAQLPVQGHLDLRSLVTRLHADPTGHTPRALAF